MLTKILHFVQNDAPGRKVLLSHCSRPGRWYAVPKGAETTGLGGFLGLTGLWAGGFLSFTALRAEGCGIALSGDEYYNAAFRRSRPYRVS